MHCFCPPRVAALTLLAAVMALTGCGGSPGRPAPVVTSLTIVVSPPTLQITGPALLQCFASYSDGSTGEIGATWVSSDPGVLTVTPSVTGATAFLLPVSVGTATVSATAGHHSARLTFTVVSTRP